MVHQVVSDSVRVTRAIDALNALDGHLRHLRLTWLVRDYADHYSEFKFCKEELITEIVDAFILIAQVEIDDALSHLKSVNTIVKSSQLADEKKGK